MRRLNWRAGAFAVGLALAPAAVSAQPSPYPRIQLPTGPLGLPNLQVRNLEIRDIGFGSPATGAVSIGRVVFSGFSRAGDGVRAERVVFENVVGQLEDRRIEVPEIRVAALSLPLELFRALTEGGAADLDWVGLLQKTAVGEIAVPVLADHHAVLKLQSSYKGLVLKSLRNGILESAQFDGVEGRSSDDAPEKLSLSLGEVQYRKLDIAELLRFATGGGRGEAKLLLERATARGLRLSTGDMTMGVDTVELAGLEGRAPELALDDRTSGPRIVVPGREAGERERRMARYAQSVLRHLRLGRYSLEGISVRSPEFGQAAIGAVTIGGFSAKGFDQFEVRDVTLSAGNMVKFEHFVIEKVGFGSLVDAALAAAAEGREPDFSPAALGDLRLAAVRLARLDVISPAGPISLGAFRLEVDDPQAAVPEKLTLALERLKLDATRSPPHEGRDKLLALGYREILSDTHIQLRWASGERALILQDTNMSIDRIGRLDLDLRLENIELLPATADPDAAERALSNAQFASALLALTDLGLAERLFAEIARGAGLPPELVRAQLAAEMRAQAVANFGPALAPGSAEAIEAFIRSPGRIAIGLAPRSGDGPLTMAELERMSQPEFVRRLTVTIAIPQN